MYPSSYLMIKRYKVIIVSKNKQRIPDMHLTINAKSEDCALMKGRNKFLLEYLEEPKGAWIGEA